jgi:hypothetical protein
MFEVMELSAQRFERGMHDPHGIALTGKREGDCLRSGGLRVGKLPQRPV